SRNGTSSGAMMEAIRPNAAAAPAPEPRVGVGYSSGPIAYSAPQAPRLKNDSAMPAAMMVAGVGARPNSPAATAEPRGKAASGARRPHTSMSQAATAYPGSWASVMTRVSQTDWTRPKPWDTSRL